MKLVAAKQWLVENSYEDVVKLIEKVEKGWQKKGTSTRRNWWDVLSGDEQGNNRRVEGVKFPILRAARLRRGWADVEGSLCRNTNEEVPNIVPQARWTGSTSKTP